MGWKWDFLLVATVLHFHVELSYTYTATKSTAESRNRILNRVITRIHPTDNAAWLLLLLLRQLRCHRRRRLRPRSGDPGIRYRRLNPQLQEEEIGFRDPGLGPPSLGQFGVQEEALVHLQSSYWYLLFFPFIFHGNLLLPFNHYCFLSM